MFLGPQRWDMYGYFSSLEGMMSRDVFVSRNKTWQTALAPMHPD